jgi:hypothetical protein
MNVVFGGGLWPLGWSVGYVEADLSSVVEAFSSWMKELRRRARVTQLDGPLVDQLATLEPLEAPWTRELLVGTTGAWTAHFSNSIGGGDSWPRVSYLAGQLETRWVVATHIPPRQYSLPATQLWLGGPSGDSLGYVRTIAAGVFDGGRWTFDTWGAIQPWEDVDTYSAPRIQDRFTRELLLRYLHALGIEADDPSFYGRGLRFDERSVWRWLRPRRRLSVAEARKDYVRSPARP